VAVAFAAAGSGGHVFPALAVAGELHRRGIPKEDLVFFGGDRMEATTVPEAGYPFVGVDIRGLRRSASIDNLSLPNKVRRARNVIASEARARGIRVVVVFGGYVAVPAALAASKLRLPLVVHEANAVPGLANKFIARRARNVFVSFEGARRAFRHAELIGSPLRSTIAAFDRDALRSRARRRYGMPEEGPVLGVIGGSLGASFLNDVAAILGHDHARSFGIVQTTGAIHHESIAADAASEPRWTTLGFEPDLQDLYAAADLVLCRGGAISVSEVQATRTPAVVVPLPAGGGYQRENAADLVATGGGIVVEQTTPEEIAEVVRSLLDDENALARMRASTPAVDHMAAAAVIADRIEELIDA